MISFDLFLSFTPSRDLTGAECYPVFVMEKGMTWNSTLNICIQPGVGIMKGKRQGNFVLLWVPKQFFTVRVEAVNSKIQVAFMADKFSTKS